MNMKAPFAVVAATTYKEIFRFKVLWAAPVVAVFVALITVVSLTMGDRKDAEALVEQVTTALTHAYASLGMLFAIIAGATLVSREVNRKILHPVIVKPLPLGGYFAGRFMGSALFFLMCSAALSSLFFAVLWTVKGSPEPLIFASYFFLTLAFACVAAAAMAFAQVFRSPMAGGAFVFVFAEAAALRDMVVEAGPKLPEWLKHSLAALLDVIHYLLPSTEEFFVTQDLISRGGLLWERLAWTVPYGAVYILAALAAGAYFFARYTRFRVA